MMKIIEYTRNEKINGCNVVYIKLKGQLDEFYLIGNLSHEKILDSYKKRNNLYD